MRFQRCFFLGVLDKKWVENRFLDWKKQKPCFSSHHSSRVLGIYRQHIVFFFAKNRAYNMLSVQLTSKKNIKGSSVDPFFVGQVLGLAYQAHNAYPRSFFFSICLIILFSYKKYYLFICIFKNNFSFMFRLTPLLCDSLGLFSLFEIMIFFYYIDCVSFFYEISVIHL